MVNDSGETCCFSLIFHGLHLEVVKLNYCSTNKLGIVQFFFLGSITTLARKVIIFPGWFCTGVKPIPGAWWAHKVGEGACSSLLITIQTWRGCDNLTWERFAQCNWLESLKSGLRMQRPWPAIDVSISISQRWSYSIGACTFTKHRTKRSKDCMTMWKTSSSSLAICESMPLAFSAIW